MAENRRLMTGWAALALVLSMGGCDKVASAVDPCSNERACEVDGVDLIIDNATLDAKVISEINKPVVPVGSTVEVSYRILNRGRESSSATVLKVCLNSASCSSMTKSVDIPVLKPGNTSSGKVILVLPDDHVGDYGIRLAVDGYSRNNQTVDLLIEQPNLVTAINVLAEEAQVGTDVPAVITIKNEAYVASAAESTARICLRNYGDKCYEQYAPSDIKTSALEAGSIQIDTISFLLPLSALVLPDIGTTHELMACADANDTTGGSSDCAAKGFTALPNLDLACSVVDIAPGQTHSGTLTATDCDLNASGKSDLYRFESEVNGRFVVDVTDFASSQNIDYVGLYVITPRGAVVAESPSWLAAGDSFTFAVGQAGTYYLAVNTRRDVNGQTYSIRFTQQE